MLFYSPVAFRADPCKCDANRGYSALHHAAAGGHLACVVFLVEFGVNVWTLNNAFRTALDVAATAAAAAGGGERIELVDYLDRVADERSAKDARGAAKQQATAVKDTERRLRKVRRREAAAQRKADVELARRKSTESLHRRSRKQPVPRRYSARPPVSPSFMNDELRREDGSGGGGGGVDSDRRCRRLDEGQVAKILNDLPEESTSSWTSENLRAAARNLLGRSAPTTTKSASSKAVTVLGMVEDVWRVPWPPSETVDTVGRVGMKSSVAVRPPAGRTARCEGTATAGERRYDVSDESRDVGDVRRDDLDDGTAMRRSAVRVVRNETLFVERGSDRPVDLALDGGGPSVGHPASNSDSGCGSYDSDQQEPNNANHGLFKGPGFGTMAFLHYQSMPVHQRRRQLYHDDHLRQYRGDQSTSGYDEDGYDNWCRSRFDGTPNDDDVDDVKFDAPSPSSSLRAAPLRRRCQQMQPTMFHDRVPSSRPASSPAAAPWMTTDVDEFLAAHDLLEYRDEFRRERVDTVAALTLLTDEDIRDQVGLPLGPRRILTDALDRLTLRHRRGVSTDGQGEDVRAWPSTVDRQGPLRRPPSSSVAVTSHEARALLSTRL